MDRRTFMKLSALGLISPSLMAKTTGPAKFSLKKNLVLVTLDLGLYEKNFREGGVNSKYMNDYFYDFI